MNLRTALCIALLAWPVIGQEGDANEPEDATSKRDEVLAAIELPSSAQALRKKGVDKAEVKEALRAAKSKRVKARNAKALLDESAKAVDENGKIDNFGAFVKSKLNEGLRGRELAAAIRAEHKKRGKGKPEKASSGKGKSGDAGSGKSKGKPEQDDDAKSGKSKGKPEKQAESESDRTGGGKSDDAKGDGSANKGGGKGKGRGKNK